VTRVASTALAQCVRRTIERYDLLPSGTRVLVGLSGGSDSVALTLLLGDLAGLGGFQVVSVAHLNHRLRPTADRDEAFCRALADRLRLPIVVESADVAHRAAVAGLSLEDAARRIRYDFLDRAAEDCRATRIAVGHTRDDQAETFMLKLLRGAGSTGLGGIYPRRGPVVRPLLDVSRRELRAFLAFRGEPWVEDESNADLANPRNRVRHRLLPEMDLVYGGGGVAAIARAADIVREDGQWLDELAEARFTALATVALEASAPELVAFDASALAAEPAPIRRRMVLLAMRRGAGGGEIGRSHVESALALLQGQGRGAEVPGGRWELRRGKLVLSSSASKRSDTL
jgi:tRNA(Ile)-lysidine synthase